MDHDELDGGVPEGAVITSVLTIVEYIHPEDEELWKADFSHDGSGNSLPWEKVSALCDYAKMNSQAPIIARMVRAQLMQDDDE